MDAQPRQQVGQAAGHEHEVDVVAVEERSDEVLLEVARRGGDGADAQDLALFASPLAEHLDQFVARREDARRRTESATWPASVSDERAAGAVEQRLAEVGLELLDLRRQCRRRHVQLAGCARQVAVLGDRPEVAQVVEVERGRHVARWSSIVRFR